MQKKLISADAAAQKVAPAYYSFKLEQSMLTLPVGFRPQLGMYEDVELLFPNLVLPLLGIALAHNVFQIHRTFE